MLVNVALVFTAQPRAYSRRCWYQYESPAKRKQHNGSRTTSDKKTKTGVRYDRAQRNASNKRVATSAKNKNRRVATRDKHNCRLVACLKSSASCRLPASQQMLRAYLSPQICRRAPAAPPRRRRCAAAAPPLRRRYRVDKRVDNCSHPLPCPPAGAQRTRRWRATTRTSRTS